MKGVKMKAKGFLLIVAFCVSAQAADELSLMKFKATNSCQGCDLKGAEFEGANLEDANLEGADLSRAKLEGADLRYANLTGASLKDADLRYANLTGAKLRYANLCKTIMPWGEDNSGC